MFSQLLNSIRSSVVRTIFKVSLVTPESQSTSKQNNLNYSGGEENQQFGAAKQESVNNKQGAGDKKEPTQNASRNEAGGEKKKLSPIVNKDKVGRNDPCVCGSGKKYKKCCGK
jgi:preprotein translocase subunit SecA